MGIHNDAEPLLSSKTLGVDTSREHHGGPLQVEPGTTLLAKDETDSTTVAAAAFVSSPMNHGEQLAAGGILPTDVKTVKPFIPKGPLVVVHAMHYYDPNALIAEGVELTMDRWDQLGLPVHHLRGPMTPAADGGKVDSHYTTPRATHETLRTRIGEHFIVPSTGEMTFVGGYYYDCLAYAVGHAVLAWEKMVDRPKELTIHLLAPMIYTRSKGRNTDADVPAWPHATSGSSNRLHEQVRRLAQCDEALPFSNDFYRMFDIDDSIGGVKPTDEGSLAFRKNHELLLQCDGQLVEAFGASGKPRITINLKTRL